MAVAQELIERPYIAVGFLAWLLLVPLALTSTRRMTKILGKFWHKLHRLIYCVALLAILHVFWLAKSSYLEAVIYGLLLLILLSIRVVDRKDRLIRLGSKVSV